jgi:uncharacterized protein YqeY
MTLIEQIKNDLKESLKKGDFLSQKTLRLLLAAIQNVEKEKRFKLSKENLEDEELEKKSQLTDEEIQEVIFKEVKKRKDAISEFKKGNREDLASQEEAELKILEKYLPPQLTEEEIRAEARKIIEEKKERNLGAVMSILMAKYKGRIDRALASQIVREEIIKEG